MIAVVARAPLRAVAGVRRVPPLLLVGGGVVGLVALVAVLAPWISPHDPTAPLWEPISSPSRTNLLGTDDLGRDILSQLVWGARASLVVAVLAASLAVGVGVVVGVSVGLAGGAVDFVAMRVVDVLLAIPVVPLLLVVVALAGPGRGTIILAIGLLGWPRVCRVMRSQTLTLASRGYVDAARGFGGRLFYILRRHMVPAVAPLIASSYVTIAGVAVGLDAGLAFLGLADPTTVSWGRLLDNNRLMSEGLYATSAWTWIVLPAGCVVAITVLGFALVGVALEPQSNPAWERGR
ncbi:MAG TPA: ABC transporter permease [Candidatus Dormibacteraeota bacterium]|nr:ABC transporter permease [Candidatus Dormibacteraeota bacterium]